MIDQVEAVVREALGASSVTRLSRLTGGASRQTWTCTVNGVDVVVQRQRAGDDRNMAIEADLVRAAWAAGVPVPEVLAFVGVDAAGSGGAATMITRRVVGETIARKILRDDTYREARQRLVADLGRALAGVHRIDPADIDGLVEADPLAGTSRAPRPDRAITPDLRVGVQVARRASSLCAGANHRRAR